MCVHTYIYIYICVYIYVYVIYHTLYMLDDISYFTNYKIHAPLYFTVGLINRVVDRFVTRS